MTVKTFSGIGVEVEGSIGLVAAVGMGVTKEEKREVVVVGSMLVAEGEREKKLNKLTKNLHCSMSCDYMGVVRSAK